jgi:predicted dehydrogenase
MADELSLDFFKQKGTEEGVIDTSKKVKIGIIGTGWIAANHIAEYLKMPDVEVVALADLVPGKAEAFGKKYGCDARCYLSGHEMLEAEELDGVSVCTYNTQHAPCTIDALEHGVNVMLEKPFTVTLDEAIEIMKAEKKSGKILTIGFQPRLSENMQMIKKIVDSGELGKVYYIQTGGGRQGRDIPVPFGTSFIAKETGGVGSVGDIGCYSLDMVLNAVGYPKPLTVSGYTSDFFGKDPATYPGHPEYAEAFGVDDFAAGFVRLEGGIILDFRIAWAQHVDTFGDTLIVGTKGTLKIPSMPCYNGDLPSALKLHTEIAGKMVEVDIPKTKCPNLFYQKLRSFVDSIKNGGEATIPSSQIVINQAIIDGIVKSSQLGKEIAIEIPEV